MTAVESPRSSAANARPSAPEGLPELFVAAAGEGAVTYQPTIGVVAKLHFVDAKAGVDIWRNFAFLVPLVEQTLDLDFATGTTAKSELLRAGAHEPEAGASFLSLPKRAISQKQLTAWKKSLLTHLYQQHKLELLACPALKLLAQPDESAPAFRARVEASTRRARRRRAGPARQVRSQVSAVAKQACCHRGQAGRRARPGQRQTGRHRRRLRRCPARRIDRPLGDLGHERTARRFRDKERGPCEKRDRRRGARRSAAHRPARKWAELQAEANAKLAALQTKAPGTSPEIIATAVAARKADTDVGTLTLVWLPFRRDAAGNPSYAFSLA